MTENKSEVPSDSVSLETIMVRGKPVIELVKDGWRPHRKIARRGTAYLTMRKDGKERSVGPYDERVHVAIKKILPPSTTHVDSTEEEVIPPSVIEQESSPEEGLPENFSPELEIEEEEVSSIARRPKSTFLRTPITRHATIPKTFVPTIKVLRYFEILKEEGYTGDFSEFVNEMVETHFGKCHGLLQLIVHQS